jgi:hypothetical protein
LVDITTVTALHDLPVNKQTNRSLVTSTSTK